MFFCDLGNFGRKQDFEKMVIAAASPKLTDCLD